MCSPTAHHQDTWKDVKKYIDFSTERVSDCFEEIGGILGDFSKKTLLILDDVSYDRQLNTGGKGMLSKLSYNARWLNLSIIVICHKVFNVGNSFRENLEHLILFRTVSPTELETIVKMFNFLKSDEKFKQLFHKIVTDQISNGTNLHPFLYVNFQNGNDVYSCFSHRISIKY